MTRKATCVSAEAQDSLTKWAYWGTPKSSYIDPSVILYFLYFISCHVGRVYNRRLLQF